MEENCSHIHCISVHIHSKQQHKIPRNTLEQSNLEQEMLKIYIEKVLGPKNYKRFKQINDLKMKTEFIKVVSSSQIHLFSLLL